MLRSKSYLCDQFTSVVCLCRASRRASSSQATRKLASWSRGRAFARVNRPRAAHKCCQRMRSWPCRYQVWNLVVLWSLDSIFYAMVVKKYDFCGSFSTCDWIPTLLKWMCWPFWHVCQWLHVYFATTLSCVDAENESETGFRSFCSPCWHPLCISCA